MLALLQTQAYVFFSSLFYCFLHWFWHPSNLFPKLQPVCPFQNANLTMPPLFQIIRFLLLLGKTEIPNLPDPAWSHSTSFLVIPPTRCSVPLEIQPYVLLSPTGLCSHIFSSRTRPFSTTISSIVNFHSWHFCSFSSSLKPSLTSMMW